MKSRFFIDDFFQYNKEKSRLSTRSESTNHSQRMQRLEEVILSDAQLKACIESQLTQSLSLSSGSNPTYHFDPLSSLEIFFNHLKPLIHISIPINDELIKKTSHLLIDSFILWYRSLAFYPYVNDSLNEFILGSRWSKYLLLIICHFLTNNITHKHFLSYNQSFQRLIEYQGKHLVNVHVSEIFEELRGFLVQLNNFHLTSIEFSLLSILLVIRYGNIKFELIHICYHHDLFFFSRFIQSNNRSKLFDLIGTDLFENFTRTYPRQTLSFQSNLTHS